MPALACTSTGLLYPVMRWALRLGCAWTNSTLASESCDAGSLDPAACDQTCSLAEANQVFFLLLEVLDMVHA